MFEEYIENILIETSLVVNFFEKNMQFIFVALTLGETPVKNNSKKWVK